MGHGTRERTWTEIERRIVRGEMAAGARLDEEELAGQLEVDTPVVREALCRLERDGFVRPEDGGAFEQIEPLEKIRQWRCLDCDKIVMLD